MSGDDSILRGITDYIADKISKDIGHDVLIPLDELGKLAYIDTEISQVFLITIEDARFVPASNQDRNHQ